MKISVLCSARKESKFLAQFLMGYFTHTKDLKNTEILVMANQHDDWNRDLFEHFKDRVTFKFEDWGYGRDGLHLYFNELLKEATGDWILYMCEDHRFLMQGWDEYLRFFITKSGFSHNRIQMITPRFYISGAMVHMVSRAWVETTGWLGGYGNIDSWFGRIAGQLPEGRNVDTGEIMFHDYTSEPDILDPKRGQIKKPGQAGLPAWESDEIQGKIDLEVKKLKEAIKGGK